LIDGYISLSRKILESDFWKLKPFSKPHAWIDLIFLAQWKDSCYYARNSKIDVKRGQLAYSMLTLQARWGWSHSKCVNFL